MLVQLAQCEFAIGKTQTVYEMNELETQNYEKIYQEIGKCMESILFDLLGVGLVYEKIIPPFPVEFQNRAFQVHMMKLLHARMNCSKQRGYDEIDKVQIFVVLLNSFPRFQSENAPD